MDKQSEKARQLLDILNQFKISNPRIVTGYRNGSEVYNKVQGTGSRQIISELSSHLQREDAGLELQLTLNSGEEDLVSVKAKSYFDSSEIDLADMRNGMQVVIFVALLGSNELKFIQTLQTQVVCQVTVISKDQNDEVRAAYEGLEDPEFGIYYMEEEPFENAFSNLRVSVVPYCVVIMNGRMLYKGSIKMEKVLFEVGLHNSFKPFERGESLPRISIKDQKTNSMITLQTDHPTVLIDIVDKHSFELARESLKLSNGKLANTPKFCVIYYGDSLPPGKFEGENFQFIWAGKSLINDDTTHNLKVKTIPYSILLEEGDVKKFGNRMGMDLQEFMTSEEVGEAGDSAEIENILQQFNLDNNTVLQLVTRYEIEYSNEGKKVNWGLNYISGRIKTELQQAFVEFKRRIAQVDSRVRYQVELIDQAVVQKREKKEEEGKETVSPELVKVPRWKEYEERLHKQERQPLLRINYQLQQTIKQQELKLDEINDLKLALNQKQLQVKKLMSMIKERTPQHLLSIKSESVKQQGVLENRNKELLQQSLQQETQINLLKRENQELKQQLTQIRSSLNNNEQTNEQWALQLKTLVKKLKRSEQSNLVFKAEVQKKDEQIRILRSRVQEYQSLFKDNSLSKMQKELDDYKAQLQQRQTENRILKKMLKQYNQAQEEKIIATRPKLPTLANKRTRSHPRNFKSNELNSTSLQEMKLASTTKLRISRKGKQGLNSTAKEYLNPDPPSDSQPLPTQIKYQITHKNAGNGRLLLLTNLLLIKQPLSSNQPSS